MWIEGTRIVRDGYVSVSRDWVCEASKLPGLLARNELCYGASEHSNSVCCKAWDLQRLRGEYSSSLKAFRHPISPKASSPKSRSCATLSRGEVSNSCGFFTSRPARATPTAALVPPTPRWARLIPDSPSFFPSVWRHLERPPVLANPSRASRRNLFRGSEACHRPMSAASFSSAAGTEMCDASMARSALG